MDTRGFCGVTGAPRDTQQARDRNQVPLWWSQPLRQQKQELSGGQMGLVKALKSPVTCPSLKGLS